MKLPALPIAIFVAAGVLAASPIAAHDRHSLALFLGIAACCVAAGFALLGMRRAKLAWALSLLAWFSLAAAAAQIERMAIPSNEVTRLAGSGQLDLDGPLRWRGILREDPLRLPWGIRYDIGLGASADGGRVASRCRAACGRPTTSSNAAAEIRRRFARATRGNSGAGEAGAKFWRSRSFRLSRGPGTARDQPDGNPAQSGADARSCPGAAPKVDALSGTAARPLVERPGRHAAAGRGPDGDCASDAAGRPQFSRFAGGRIFQRNGSVPHSGAGGFARGRAGGALLLGGEKAALADRRESHADDCSPRLLPDDYRGSPAHHAGGIDGDDLSARADALPAHGAAQRRRAWRRW